MPHITLNNLILLFCLVMPVVNSFMSLQISDLVKTAEDKIEMAGEYTFSASSGTYSEISGGTISTASGDDGAENIELPFEFIYDSLTYTTARISVNGWLELGQSFSGDGFYNDLAGPEYRPLLAPFWDDLYDDSTSLIRYQTLGSIPNRILVIQWKDIRWAGSTGSRQNFQIRLYEGSQSIEFIYGEMTNSTNTSASIGINDPVGGAGHFLSVTPGSPVTVSQAAANNNITSINYLVEWYDVYIYSTMF